jgi:branched-chain amino acid transport system ATP-binding protein
VSLFVRHPAVLVFAVLLALSAAWYVIGAPISLTTQIAVYTLYGAGVGLLVSYTSLVPFGASVFFGCASYATAFAMLRGAGNEIEALAFACSFRCCWRR